MARWSQMALWPKNFILHFGLSYFYLPYKITLWGKLLEHRWSKLSNNDYDNWPMVRNQEVDGSNPPQAIWKSYFALKISFDTHQIQVLIVIIINNALRFIKIYALLLAIALKHRDNLEQPLKVSFYFT